MCKGGRNHVRRSATSRSVLYAIRGLVLMLIFCGAAFVVVMEKNTAARVEAFLVALPAGLMCAAAFSWPLHRALQRTSERLTRLEERFAEDRDAP
jgi:heme/copper-type cytochrome/quinol oxidase subunit 4